MSAIRLRNYPEYEFEIRWEKYHLEDRYNSPVEYLNSLRRGEYSKDSFENKNWHLFFWEHHKLKSCYEICRFDSDLWGDVDKDSIFEKVFIFQGNTGGYSTTSLHDFEIYAMSNGWDLVTMGGCNANTGGRDYKKNGNYITVEYGAKTIDYMGKEIEFYKFSVSTPSNIFHLPINRDKFNEVLQNFG